MSYTNILVPVDTSYLTAKWAEPSLAVARDMARLSGGTLHFATVIPDNLFKGYYPNLYSDSLQQDALVKLRRLVEDLMPDVGSAVFHVANGGICREIIRLARQLSIDLIVMASHGPIAADYLLGSNAAHIALHAPCSVFIVRNQEHVHAAKD